MKDDPIRLSVNMTADTAEFLREAASREGRSITEIIRRAVAVYQFMVYEAEGNVYVEDKDGNLDKVMFL